MDGRPDLDWTLTDEESRDGIGTKYFNIMWAEENSLYKLMAGILNIDLVISWIIMRTLFVR